MRYENVYLLGKELNSLGTDLQFIEHPLPALSRGQIEVAKKEGCTAKGNDQVRFELGYLALGPKIKIIAPWHLPEFYEKFAKPK